MIRFCDKEVYTIYEEELDRVKLFSFFCEKGHSTDIILVIDYQNEFVGIITYERLLNNVDHLIQKQSLTADQNIWSDAYKIFSEDKNAIYIPVFKNGELIYFCYNTKKDFEEIEVMSIINELCENEKALFIPELYPKIQVVCIHDLNEIAFKFYQLLLKRKIPVEVCGDIWNELLEIKTEVIPCSSYARMEIYAEGTPLVKEDRDINSKSRFTSPRVWGFLKDIACINQIVIENRISYDSNSNGKKTFICSIPDFQDLNKYSIDDEFRFLKHVHLNNPELNFKNVLILNQINKIYNMDYNQIIELINIETERDSEMNDDLETKKYGMGENIIYIIGPCIVLGAFTLIKDKLIYSLYQIISEKFSNNYSVKGIPVPELDFTTIDKIYNSLSIRDKDIVIFVRKTHYELCKKFNIANTIDLNLLDFYNSRPDNETWFMDVPIHTTGVANKAISKEIVKRIIEPEINKMDFTKKPKCLQRGKAYLKEEDLAEITDYLEEIKKYKFNMTGNKSIGSIIMNCNPMTLGHMYLIDYARKHVDYLYIFVVEEDRSFFKFKDRFDIITKAVKDMENVRAIPSGKFILSNKTLPSYFTKEFDQDKIIDATDDIEIFCEYIAPAMDVSMRFVGEEPLDKITLQYNMEMRRTLSDYGMGFTEIPRKEMDGEVISASRVRHLLKNGKIDEIRKMVPDATFDYLISTYSDVTAD